MDYDDRSNIIGIAREMSMIKDVDGTTVNFVYNEAQGTIGPNSV